MGGFATVFAGAVLLGLALGPRDFSPATSRERGIVTLVLSGLLVLHCWVSLLALVSIKWSAASIVLPLGFLPALLWAVRRRPAAEVTAPFGFGDAIAAAALGAFAVSAFRLWIVTSDFFYTWGVKGEKFALARGIDVHYLTGPVSITGWYPTLLPELHALTALARGRFIEREMMAWSVLWLLLIWLGVRAALRVVPVEKHLAQAGTGAILALCAAVGIAIRLAGGADWLIALVLVVGAGALLVTPPEAAADSSLAVAAAVGAAAKVEGVVLAAILLGLDLVRRLTIRPRLQEVRAWLLTLCPSVFVVLLWIGQNTRAQLWPRSLSAAPSAAHVHAWLGTLAGQFLGGGSTFHLPLLLLLIPLLFCRSRTRFLGTALALQLAFYEAIYVVSPGSPEVYVRTTFERLAVQLMPAVVIGLAALLADGNETTARKNLAPLAADDGRRAG